MAKTGKMKKKPSTIHSRAARRAVSPSINLDKSIKLTTRTSPPAPEKSKTLGARPTGISKKTKSKPLKRQQRVRREKELERAGVNMDKLQLKVAKSVSKEKKVDERKKGWDDVNGGVEKRKKKNPFDTLEDDEGGVEGERESVSDDETDAVDHVEKVEGKDGDYEMVPESVPLPVATVEEDEML